MSKHNRIANYFTDGLNRWALVDNLGLMRLNGLVDAKEECFIRDNVTPVIERFADGFRPSEPIVLFASTNGPRELSDCKHLLKNSGTIGYKVWTKDSRLLVWFEDGHQVWFQPGTVLYLTPVFIYNLYRAVLSSPDCLIERFPIISEINNTLENYETCSDDYFGWVSEIDAEPNHSFENNLPITLAKSNNSQTLKHLKSFTLQPVVTAMAFSPPPSNSLIPNTPNTQRIPAMEGSEAVWDADSMVKHILSAAEPLGVAEVMKQVLNERRTTQQPLSPPENRKNIDMATGAMSSFSGTPSPEELKRVKQEIDDYLTSTHPMLKHIGSLLELYVAKQSHEEFYHEVYRNSKKYGVPTATGFIFALGIYPTGDMFENLFNYTKERLKAKQKEVPKKTPLLRLEIVAGGYLTVVGETGCLSIRQKGSALNATLKELYKLTELNLIGENTISATTLLSVAPESKLTLSNTQFMGNIISLTGFNIFKNVLVERGTYEDVNINAKVI